MAEAQVATGAVAGADVHYGGFWRRFVAFIVDWFLVSSAVAIVFLLLAAVFPVIGNSVILQVPLDIGTTERTIESKTVDSKDGNVAVKTTEKIVEETVLGKWTYFFREIETKRESSSGSTEWRTTKTTKQRIDPVTREEIKGTNLENIILLALLIYWAVMESSRYQASLGKMIFGMQVVDRDGKRLTLPIAIGRMLGLIELAEPEQCRHKRRHEQISWCAVRSSLTEMTGRALEVGRTMDRVPPIRDPATLDIELGIVEYRLRRGVEHRRRLLVLLPPAQARYLPAPIPDTERIFLYEFSEDPRGVVVAPLVIGDIAEFAAQRRIVTVISPGLLYQRRGLGRASQGAPDRG